MTDATDIDPKQVRDMVRMLDPANHLLEYFHELNDHGQSPEAIALAVACGLGDFVRDIKEPQILLSAIQLIADELVDELPLPSNKSADPL